MLAVNKDRVNDLLMGLGEFGKTDQGVTRLAYSDEDRAAQNWLLEKVADLKLQVREDVVGNVFEWCKDWYSNSYVSNDKNNPVGHSSGSFRVFRGGSWSCSASRCRVANRNYNSPSNRYYDRGFRVVCLP